MLKAIPIVLFSYLAVGAAWEAVAAPPGGCALPLMSMTMFVLWPGTVLVSLIAWHDIRGLRRADGRGQLPARLRLSVGGVGIFAVCFEACAMVS